MKPQELEPDYVKGRSNTHALISDWSQQTGPAGQSEQTTLFRKAGFKDDGTKIFQAEGKKMLQ